MYIMHYTQIGTMHADNSTLILTLVTTIFAKIIEITKTTILYLFWKERVKNLEI